MKIIYIHSINLLSFAFALFFLAFVLRGLFILHVYKQTKYVKANFPAFFQKHKMKHYLMDFISPFGWKQLNEIKSYNDSNFLEIARKINLYNKIFFYFQIFFWLFIIVWFIFARSLR